MATFVPGFVSQPLRDWLKRSRDAYGKAPLASDPKAQLQEIETRHGPAPKATLAQVADHIVYLVETAGIDHVGIGSDFFGGPQPLGLEHVGRFPHLIAELLKRGFSEADVAKIACGNALRAMRAVEAVGEKLRAHAPARRRAARGLPGGVSRRQSAKHLLHEHQIEPAPEFAPDLVEMRAAREAEPFVERAAMPHCRRRPRRPSHARRASRARSSRWPISAAPTPKPRAPSATCTLCSTVWR